jgi:hypothetical protein
MKISHHPKVRKRNLKDFFVFSFFVSLCRKLTLDAMSNVERNFTVVMCVSLAKKLLKMELNGCNLDVDFLSIVSCSFHQSVEVLSIRQLSPEFESLPKFFFGCSLFSKMIFIFLFFWKDVESFWQTLDGRFSMVYNREAYFLLVYPLL